MSLLGIISYGTQELLLIQSFGRNFIGKQFSYRRNRKKINPSSRQDLSNAVSKHSRRPEYSSRVRLGQGQPFLLH